MTKPQTVDYNSYEGITLADILHARLLLEHIGAANLDKFNEMLIGHMKKAHIVRFVHDDNLYELLEGDSLEISPCYCSYELPLDLEQQE